MLILGGLSKGNKMMQQWFAVSLGDALLAQARLSMLEQYSSDCYEQAEKCRICQHYINMSQVGCTVM